MLRLLASAGWLICLLPLVAVAVPLADVSLRSTSLFVVTDAGAFFEAEDEHGPGLWHSDGTSSGTHLLSRSGPSEQFTLCAQHLFSLGLHEGSFYFLAGQDEILDLWRVTPGHHVEKVADLGLGCGDYQDEPFPLLSDSGYVMAIRAPLRNAAEPFEPQLLKVDLSSGAVSVAEPPPGLQFRVIRGEVNGRVLVLAWHATAGYSFHAVDPSTLVTTQLGQGLYFRDTTPFFDDQLIAGGARLWITDGSPSGTTSLIPQGLVRTRPGLQLGERALIPLAIVNNNYQLWSTDGTQAGTSLVASFSQSGFGGIDSAIYGVGEFGVFAIRPTVDLPVSFLRTDGTAPGTLGIDRDSANPLTPASQGNEVFKQDRNRLLVAAYRPNARDTAVAAWAIQGAEPRPLKLTDGIQLPLLHRLHRYGFSSDHIFYVAGPSHSGPFRVYAEAFPLYRHSFED